jgi:hypothetical protein
MESRGALASLAIWGCEVELGGRNYTIPARSAADWFIVILTEGTWLPIIPGMLEDPDERLAVLDDLAFGTVTLDDLVDRQQLILEEMSGMRWWVADKLIRGASANWRPIGAELTKRGVDLDKVSLAAALDVIYAFCCSTMTREELTQFKLELERPPAGMDPDQMYEAEAMTNTLFSLLGPPPVPPTPVS